MESNYIKAASAYNNMNALPLTKGGDKGDGGVFEDFSGLVTMAMNNAQTSIAKGERMSAKAIMKDTNLSNVVTSVSEAEIALQTIVTLRDKMLNAYQEIIKMPI